MYLNAKGVVMSESGKTTNWTITGAAGGTRSGTSLNDVFQSASGDTLVGGIGDDTYHLWDPTSRVVEDASGGIDTVYARFWGGMALSANVENLYLISAGANWGTGNALGNVIVAGKAAATLDGQGGDDVLVGGAGADVFKISAGNGSDALVNFKPGWDAVKLTGYSIKSFVDLVARSQQVGADVRIQLSPTETLVLRDVKLSALSAADFNLPLDPVKPLESSLTIDQPAAGWNSNGWYVLNNTWNINGLTWGKDVSITTQFRLGDMTDGTTFTWSTPLTTNVYPTILAYPELIFGISPKNPAGYNPTDTAMVLPVKVADVTALTARQDVTFLGNLSGFNVAYDIWLTSKAGGGESTITNEVMIWVHKGSFDAFGTVVGTYTSPEGLTAKVYHKDTYTAVVFDKDLPKGTIDIAGILKTLQDLHIVSDQEYIGSIELGAEVVSGSGRLVVNDLDISVTTVNADGAEITKLVTGGGTTVTTSDVVAGNAAEEVSLFTPGTKAVTDSFGNALTRVTTIAQDGSATITVYDSAGKTVGIDRAVLDGAGVRVSRYSADNRLLGSTLDRTAGDGSQWTTEFDAIGAQISAVRTLTDTDGARVTQFFDNRGVLAGADRATTVADGVMTQHYDASFKLTGVEKNISSSGVIQHYDASFALISAEKHIANADGTTTIQHYDSKFALLGWDVIKVANSSVTTFEYNGKGVLDGIHVDRLGPGNVVKSVDYDGSWKVLGATLHGTALNDTLGGSTYATAFHGGLGSDRISCGSGIDTIWFDTAIGQGGVDQISAFKSGQDKLVLDADIFKALGGASALSTSEFVVGAKALTADQHIIFDKARGDLYYDVDGSGAQAAVLFAHFLTSTTLTSNDFVIG